MAHLPRAASAVYDASRGELTIAGRTDGSGDPLVAMHLAVTQTAADGSILATSHSAIGIAQLSEPEWQTLPMSEPFALGPATVFGLAMTSTAAEPPFFRFVITPVTAETGFALQIESADTPGPFATYGWAQSIEITAAAPDPEAGA